MNYQVFELSDLELARFRLHLKAPYLACGMVKINA